jgi:hypothetical protein
MVGTVKVFPTRPAASQQQVAAPPPTAPGAGLARLQALRAEAPNATGMSDAQFAVAMHQHHYADMPMVDFLTRVGLDKSRVLYELRAPGDPYGDYLR